MDTADNPFRPGAGSPPPAFVGRDALLVHFDGVARRLQKGIPSQSLVPLGLPGVGKTVLLNRFEQIAKGHGAVVEHLEADPEANMGPDAIASRLRAALYAMQPATGGLGTKLFTALRVIASVRLTFSTRGAPPISFGLDVEPLTGRGDSGDLRVDVQDLFVAVGEAAQEHHKPVVLGVDELQYLPDDVFRALILGLHRCQTLSLPVLGVGTGLPNIPGKAGDVRTYAERLFDFPEIGALTEDDAARALAEPLVTAGVSYTPDALRTTVKQAAGYPYFLQEWGFATWNVATHPIITLTMVERAGQEVRAKLDRSFFAVRVARLTPQERDYLRAMAALGAGPHRSADIAAQMGLTVQRAAPIRNRILRKGMVGGGDYGTTAFSVPLFDDYLRRTSDAPSQLKTARPRPHPDVRHL